MHSVEQVGEVISIGVSLELSRAPAKWTSADVAKDCDGLLHLVPGSVAGRFCCFEMFSRAARLGGARAVNQ